MSLQTLPNTASTTDILAAMDEAGAVIIRDAISEEIRQRMVDEVMPFIERTPMGTDDFTGRHTQRTGALVARTPTCRDLILHDTVLAAAREFLAPYTDKILLHLTQTIYINPGNRAQALHRDRLAWGTHIPREIEPQFNTIWALTNFTKENGATRLVPGSHKWNWGAARRIPSRSFRRKCPQARSFCTAVACCTAAGKTAPTNHVWD